MTARSDGAPEPNARPPATEALISRLETETPEDLRRLGDSVADVVKLIDGRIQYTESRRNAIGVIAGVLLGAGLATLTQLLKSDPISFFPARVALITFGVGLIAL